MSERTGRGLEVVAIAISALALVVSALAFAWPLVARSNERDQTENGYLTALTQPKSRAVDVASGFASLDSSAYQYASAVASVWLAVEDSNRPEVGDAHGSVTRVGSGWEVCLPDVELLDDVCRTYDNFEFGDNDRITRFTVDGVPVEKLFVRTTSELRLTSDDDADIFDAFAHAQLRDPDGAHKTYVFWVRQERHPSPFSQIDFASVVVQDASEETMSTVGTAVPESLAYWDGAYVALRVPEAVRFVQFCWEGELADKDPCDWLFNLR